MPITTRRILSISAARAFMPVFYAPDANELLAAMQHANPWFNNPNYPRVVRRKLSLLITLTTDFGNADHFVGAVKGVILSIAPRTRIIDITHEITPYELNEAAFVLAQAWHWFPRGTIPYCPTTR